jgi:hypothetical protein
MASKSQQDYDQPKEAGTPSSKSSTSILRSLLRTNPQTEDGKAAIRARLQEIVRSVPAAKYNSYKHEPIDYDNEIRILRILRGSSDDKLECMLFPSKLGQVNSESRRDRYWALSYWWGDENEVASNKITVYHE